MQEICEQNIEQTVDMPVPIASNLKELCNILHSEMKTQGLQDSNISRLSQILTKYSPNSKDYQQYVMFDPKRYTRNLVDDGNGKFNLMVLCWPKGSKSPIHDHSNSHCLLKVFTLVYLGFGWAIGGKSL